MFHFQTTMDWIKVIIFLDKFMQIPQTDHHYFQIFASLACDLLWNHRNKAYHEGTSFNALTSSRTINKVALDHYKALKALTFKPTVEKWTPPAPSYFEINFDTAIQDNFSAQAAVCRNHQGKILKTKSLINLPCTPNVGEALAAQLAISLAISLNLTQVIFEGDSQIVIFALQNPSWLRIGEFPL